MLSGGATILFSFGSALPIFAALWFLNGFAQGAGWPACAKILKRVPYDLFKNPLLSYLNLNFIFSGSVRSNLEHFGAPYQLRPMYRDRFVHLLQLGSLRNLIGGQA